MAVASDSSAAMRTHAENVIVSPTRATESTIASWQAEPGPHLLPYPEHQEQRVVRARPEHQHDQQQRGDLGHAQAVHRGLGGEPLGRQHHHHRGQHRDQRRQRGPEHRHEQRDHEGDGEPLDLAAGLARGGVGVCPGGYRARGVHREPGRGRGRADRVAHPSDQGGLLGGGESAGLGQRGQHRELLGLPVGRLPGIPHRDDAGDPGQRALEPRHEGLVRRRSASRWTGRRPP